MRQLVLATLLIGLAVATPAALARAADQPAQESPRDMLEDATRKALKAFELMLKAIPQYESPEILDNGDIIIRRKKTKPETPAPADPGAAKTKT